MPEGPPRDPLTPGERAEFEEGLISFSDRQLGLLGDIRGLDVLYAGGSSLLWIEGLSQRIGEGGSLVVLDLDEEALGETNERLAEAGLVAPVSLVAGDVFSPPFKNGSFDLAYSAGLFHELDVTEKPAEKALQALARAVCRGGRVATTDFVDSVPAAQIEDEHLRAAISDERHARKLYGIGPPERLVALHEGILENVEKRTLKPHFVEHLGKIVLAEKEPEELSFLPPEAQDSWRGRYGNLQRRIRREGYTRPATLHLEGRNPGG